MSLDPKEIEKTADAILERLRTARSKSLPVATLGGTQTLASDLRVAALRLLRDWEYELASDSKGRVTLLSTPDNLTATEIGHQLRTKMIGRNIHAFRTIKSTNDFAAQLGERGAPEGTLVTSEEQTKGKGRLGRSWHSPAGLGIYLSILLRPTFPPEDAPGMSIVTSLALADAIARYTDGEVGIKWPNDLLIRGRKVAGILTELTAERGSISYLVVGVGINANHAASDFPPDLRTTATSLRRVLKSRVSRLDLLKAFLLNFEREYALYAKDRLRKSQSRLRKYSTLIGKRVSLDSGPLRITGTCIDIDYAGNLVIDEHGERMIVSSGEVTVVKGTPGRS